MMPAFFIYHMKLLYEFCLKRIKEQIDKNRSTVSSNGNADGMLIKTPPNDQICYQNQEI